ncbi:ATP-dependent helicase [Nocardia panacis]|uniref:ATP-dependent helicase n=1 Tax=Nocardia panacis TaxID=2340916 RepID=A0A3A4L166_9NOCA|nr:UvrD-helicase domain-containing protein [Nocardia panacis]RJO75627.1 ATP-dependent helicase [Nocardia panacis]
MSDIGRERRRRWAEEQLAGLPHLSAPQRRFLSVPLMESGWQLLVHRSGVLRGRPVAFAVGRTGVYALVFTDDIPEIEQLRRIRRYAEETFGGLLLGRRQYVPHMLEVMLLMGKAVRTQAHDPYLAVDETTMRSTLLNGEQKLTPQRARDCVAAVLARDQQYSWISTANAPRAEITSADGLFGVEELREDERTRVLRRPFEEWMTFLDPDQLGYVSVNFNGPARFSGPAGTGKTVVALHRMARFAKNNPGKLLFTSFVKTLPAHHQSGFARIAERHADRAEFIGLHAWAMRFLNRRRVKFDLAEDGQVVTAFARAWSAGRHELSRIPDTDRNYWEDEVKRVIKGRGIDSFDDYEKISRPGRDGVRLSGPRKKLVWDNFYLPYQARLAEKNLDDFNDIVRKAIAELRIRPLVGAEKFGMVVVDEVQDFTLQELRLVLEIAGGGSEAQLLLVGDGQQQVYSGGWKLSDAGIPLAGRGRVLRTNFRNRAAILRYAKRIEAADTVDDLDGGTGFVLRDSDGVLDGGTVIEKSIPRADLDTELVRAITESGMTASNCAVLVNTNHEAAHYQQVLESAGLSALLLEHYNGTQHSAIEVGTVYRAKGLDFAAVFRIAEPIPRGNNPADRDRAELLARQHLVAVTRARDYLWVGLVGD